MHVCEIKESSELREAARTRERPLLLLDIDGVISLFGFPPQHPPAGRFHAIEGIPHFLSAAAAGQLHRLGRVLRAGVGERLGGSRQRSPPAPARDAGAAAVPALASQRGRRLLHARALEARRRRGVRAASVPWPGSTTPSMFPANAGPRSGARPRCCWRTEPAVGLTDAQADRLIAWASSVSWLRALSALGRLLGDLEVRKLLGEARVASSPRPSAPARPGRRRMRG